MNTSNEQKKAKLELLNKTWTYLNDNFHKFTESNKIRIALALNLKDMPTEVEGMNVQQVVMMGEIKKGDNPVRYNIGDKLNANRD